MLCERGCLPAAWLAKGGLRLRSSLTYLTRPRSVSLTRTRVFSLSLSLSLYSSLSSSLCAAPSRTFLVASPSSLPFRPSPFLVLSAFASALLVMLWPYSFALVTTFLPTEPPTPRLYNDVNSHAHVFESPHYSCDLRPDSWTRTRFLTSKATSSSRAAYQRATAQLFHSVPQ